MVQSTDSASNVRQAEADVATKTARAMFRRASCKFLIAWAVLSTILVMFGAHLAGIWGVPEGELSLFDKSSSTGLRVTALGTAVYMLVAGIVWRHIVWTVYRKVKHAL